MVAECMEKLIEKRKEGLETNGLRINMTKTKIMLVTVASRSTIFIQSLIHTNVNYKKISVVLRVLICVILQMIMR